MCNLNLACSRYSRLSLFILLSGEFLFKFSLDFIFLTLTIRKAETFSNCEESFHKLLIVAVTVYNLLPKNEYLMTNVLIEWLVHENSKLSVNLM